MWGEQKKKKKKDSVEKVSRRDSPPFCRTLPMPRRDSQSAALYLSWLEVMTRGMPPFLLVRGNQTSVLTFYS